MNNFKRNFYCNLELAFCSIILHCFWNDLVGRNRFISHISLSFAFKPMHIAMIAKHNAQIAQVKFLWVVCVQSCPTKSCTLKRNPVFWLIWHYVIGCCLKFVLVVNWQMLFVVQPCALCFQSKFKFQSQKAGFFCCLQLCYMGLIWTFAVYLCFLIQAPSGALPQSLGTA